MIYLKDSDSVAALIAGSDFPAVPTQRKVDLAAHFQGMLPEHWLQAYNALQLLVNADEWAFIEALFTGTPGTPSTPAPGHEQESGGSFDPAITSVGDNAAGSLEKVPTSGLTLPTLRTILIAGLGELQDWVAAVGTDATDATHQRANDFGVTGVVWTRKR